MTDALRYDQVRMKGAHNSYGHDPKRPLDFLRFDADEPHEYGFRCLELDLFQSSESWAWRVQHDPPFEESDEPLFSEVLGELRTWSEKAGDHDVVTILLDVKNDPLDDDEFPAELDGIIDSALDAARVYSPKHVIGPHPDLVRAARGGGWAPMSVLEGRFIFCLTGRRTKRKRRYVRTDPKERLCFADLYVDPDLPPRIPRKGHRVFLNFPVHDDDWPRALRPFAERDGFITRGFSFLDVNEWEQGLDLGINILSTDVTDDEFFRVADDAPFARVSGPR